MDFLSKIRSYLAIILLPLVMVLFVNEALNRHIHKMSNGEVVTHAHPFNTSKENPSPYQSHKHTKAEYVSLNLLSGGLAIIVALVALFKLTFRPAFKAEIFTSKAPSLGFCYIQNNKAPPLF